MKTLILALSIITLTACSSGTGTTTSSWKAAGNGFADMTIDCKASGDFTMKWHLVETNEKYAFDGKCKQNGNESLELEFAKKPPQMEGKSVKKLDASKYQLKIFKPSTKDANIEISGVLLYRK